MVLFAIDSITKELTPIWEAIPGRVYLCPGCGTPMYPILDTDRTPHYHAYPGVCHSGTACAYNTAHRALPDIPKTNFLSLISTTMYPNSPRTPKPPNPSPERREIHTHTTIPATLRGLHRAGILGLSCDVCLNDGTHLSDWIRTPWLTAGLYRDDPSHDKYLVLVRAYGYAITKGRFILHTALDTGSDRARYDIFVTNEDEFNAMRRRLFTSDASTREDMYVLISSRWRRNTTDKCVNYCADRRVHGDACCDTCISHHTGAIRHSTQYLMLHRNEIFPRH